MNRPDQIADSTPPPPSSMPRPPVQQAPISAADPRVKSPILACCLSLMPGLGQVYVGYYQRGFIHALVAAGLISLLAADSLGPLVPLGGLFLGFFWLYNMIDAARRATLYHQALTGATDIELPSDFKSPGLGGSLAGGVSITAVGVILLLHTRFGMSLDWIEDWWPAGLILFGAYLVWKALQERSRRDSDPTGL